VKDVFVHSSTMTWKILYPTWTSSMSWHLTIPLQKGNLLRQTILLPSIKLET